ncbi:hypothetical protein NC653_016208 [Populus alba x Populus x berolinensis]|uniref:Uncharacterized protein n=1 Tax=Populus alba x Populus x berolinensis TaxID=444605 RepID=A0AAD6QML1_9ROSI|nr:hypothetical protein NC653_016208 [Populus alba x Populus x berolinensis]
MFVFKFCAHFGGPVSTASGLIFTLLRVQRSESLPPLLCVLCDCKCICKMSGVCAV